LSVRLGGACGAGAQAGTREEAIATVRDRKDVGGLAPDERAIIAYVRQLLRANRVDQTVFDALKSATVFPGWWS